MRALLTFILLLLSSTTHAATPIERAQQAELDRVRAKVANQVHLSAYDLVDEMVWGWTQEPVFDKPTQVVLADVTVPVGLGTGMQALLENHISSVILKNPTSNVRLVHCPACRQVVVHSGPEATVVTRGIDNPDVLAKLGETTDRHALFIDIEAEGTFLVMRARLTRLNPDLPIVWSHTISTSANTPALLRDGADLKSAAEAREEYMAALEDRGPTSVIARVGVRTYARGDFGNTPPPPFLWFQAGVELGATEALDWTASLVIGGSHIPQAYSGLLAEARVNRLLTGRVRSHTRPDLYFFLGGSAQTLWGTATTPFLGDPINADDVLRQNNAEAPRFIFGTVELGLDLRLGQRFGLIGYLEYYHPLRFSQNIGAHVRVLGINFQSFGLEVQTCF